MIKLVLSDVDGTLIPLGAAHASSRTMQAIRRLQEAGIRFGLSTGRDVVELMRLFQGDDVAFRTGILSNGKKVFVDGEVVRLSLIGNEALARAVEVVREYPHTFITAYPLNTNERNPIYCMSITSDELAAWSSRYAFEAILVDEVPDEPIIGATIANAGPREDFERMKARILEACPEFDIVAPAPDWNDILPKGINKGTALAMLLEELGIGIDEVVVFGDADNDLAILSAVENAVVVRGATPAARAASRWQIGACEDDAVAQALEDIAQAATEGRLPAFMS